MIKTLQKEYFQKSQVFLYPLLLIPRGHKFTPVKTYIAWVDGIFPADKKLLCVYDLEGTDEFYRFENKYLLGNKLFSNFHLLEDGKGLFVFDYKSFGLDFQIFLSGHYSEMSDDVKKSILKFFGTSRIQYSKEAFHYVNSYLYPEMYFHTYAELLGVSKEFLEEVGELCPPVDLLKETLQTKKLIDL